jgi:hypothetical protein
MVTYMPRDEPVTMAVRLDIVAAFWVVDIRFRMKRLLGGSVEA